MPDDKHIILVNHVVPHHDFIIHKEGNDSWNFGNAFMGSALINQLVTEDNRIKCVIFGHSHYHFGKSTIDNKTYLSFSYSTFEQQLKQTLGFIHINET